VLLGAGWHGLGRGGDVPAEDLARRAGTAAWQAVGMAETAETADIDDLISDWLTVPDAAERLAVDVTKVRQLLRERKLIGVRRGGVLRVPALFIQDAAVLKGLPGTLTVLSDSGFSDDEALRWLFTPDDSLPGSPVRALVENRGTEVKRRAQALAL
jgi:excisionase family DNA binding protein